MKRYLKSNTVECVNYIFDVELVFDLIYEDAIAASDDNRIHLKRNEKVNEMDDDDVLMLESMINDVIDSVESYGFEFQREITPDRKDHYQSGKSEVYYIQFTVKDANHAGDARYDMTIKFRIAIHGNKGFDTAKDSRGKRFRYFNVNGVKYEQYNEVMYVFDDLFEELDKGNFNALLKLPHTVRSVEYV